MKKKIIITLTICLFAAGSIINVHLAQNDYNMDVSLADISVMAAAQYESASWVYLQKIVATAIYDDVAVIEGGTRVLLKKVPIGVEILYTMSNTFIGIAFNCEGWALSRCNQNDVRFEGRF